MTRRLIEGLFGGTIVPSKTAFEDKAARAGRRQRWRVAKAVSRERVRRGGRCGRFQYDAAVLDFLIRNQWLAECDAGNAKAVGDAVTRLLAASARL